MSLPDTFDLLRNDGFVDLAEFTGDELASIDSDLRLIHRRILNLGERVSDERCGR